ncbi:MAG: type I phosphomannose isomerase catalytic subunit [Myxococcota bacterium]
MWDKVGAKNWRRPLLLQPDNFTPPSRTPWGGTRIAGHLKRELGLATTKVVGESWELSVEPDFPSLVVDGPPFDDVVRADPEAWLGREEPLGSTGLLVKLLDADDDLSVQIHPIDDDPALDSDQSGKPESWYVVDARPGAGLYLGFVEGVGHREVERALAIGSDLSALLQFVPVQPGDAFVIEPGTPHAVGRGVTLLEPQRVLPKKRGVTYRYWDWNRRYDEEGQPDPTGRPRALHAERALAVTRWDRPGTRELLAAIRTRAGIPDLGDTACLEPIISAGGPLTSPVFDVSRLSGMGQIELPAAPALRSITVLSGSVCLDWPRGTVRVPQGQTAALPACLRSLTATLDAAHAIMCHLI